MRHYPRGWNRTLSFIVGLLLLVGGVGSALVQLWPRLRDLYLAHVPNWVDRFSEILDRTGLRIGNYTVSWITLLLVLLAIMLIVVCLITIFSQAGGKTREAVKIDAAHLRHLDSYDDQAAGRTVFTTQFMEEYIRDHLDDVPAITSVNVSNWHVKNDTAMQLRIKVARGASPLEVCAAVENLVADLDSLLVRPLPIMVRLVQGNAILQTFASGAPRVE